MVAKEDKKGAKLKQNSDFGNQKTKKNKNGSFYLHLKTKMLLALGLTGIAIPKPLYQFEFLRSKRKTKMKPMMSMRSEDCTGQWWRNVSSFSASPVIGLVAMVLMFQSTASAIDPLDETFLNVPQTLSGECSAPKDCKKGRIQHPKSRQAESCTIKCVTTCIRGGAGSPGEGPLNARRPLVVFKQGFRSRQYCLVECSDICNLIKDGEDGP